MSAMQFTPKKLYYKIGEVCEIVGVEAYVLRYWETEFSVLSPPKNKSGQRTYRPKDIEILLEIRRLLYDEGFTIAGARKRFGLSVAGKSPKEGKMGSRGGEQGRASDKSQGSKPLSQAREELENILTLLDSE